MNLASCLPRRMERATGRARAHTHHARRKHAHTRGSAVHLNCDDVSTRERRQRKDKRASFRGGWWGLLAGATGRGPARSPAASGCLAARPAPAPPPPAALGCQAKEVNNRCGAKERRSVLASVSCASSGRGVPLASSVFGSTSGKGRRESTNVQVPGSSGEE